MLESPPRLPVQFYRQSPPVKSIVGDTSAKLLTQRLTNGDLEVDNQRMPVHTFKAVGAIKHELLTGAEFAKRAGVKASTVNQWKMKGVIKPEIQVTNKIKLYAWPPKVTKRK